MIAMQSPRPSLLDLHPVEALLALLLISAAALHRLVIDPPRPIRQPVPYSSAAIAMRAVWDSEPLGSGVISPEIDEVDNFFLGREEEMLSLIARQVADWKRQPQASAAPAVGVSYGALTTEERTACAVAARSAAEQVDQQLRRVRGIQLQANPASGLTVAELRTMARQRGILSAGSRPIHKARRADLLSALGL